MFVEEEVFYIDKSDQKTRRSYPIQPEVEAIETVQSEAGVDFNVEKTFDKPEVIQVTHDFFDYHRKITEDAEQTIAVRDARNEFKNKHLAPVTPIEQLVDVSSELNMGRNLEIVRGNYNEPNHGRIGPSHDIDKVISLPVRDNSQYYIPEVRAA